MSEQEMNSYRFCSGEEPTDEMLRQIMRDAAQEAREKKEKALNAYFCQMHKNIAANQQKWDDRFKQLMNGTAVN